MEIGRKFDAYSILQHVRKTEIDGDIALLVGEGRFGVDDEDVVWDEQTFASGGANRSLDFDVDGEGLLIVGEFVDRDDLDVHSLREQIFDRGAEVVLKAGGVAGERPVPPGKSGRSDELQRDFSGGDAVLVQGKIGDPFCVRHGVGLSRSLG